MYRLFLFFYCAFATFTSLSAERAQERRENSEANTSPRRTSAVVFGDEPKGINFGGLILPKNWQEHRDAVNSAAEKAEQKRNLPEVHPAAEGATIKNQRFSWRTKDRVTPVRSQGSCKSCWAFATEAVYESVYAMEHKKKKVDCAEQCALDCSQSGDCDGGWWAFEHLCQDGCSAENEYGYKERQGPCNSQPERVYKGAYWGYVTKKDGIPLVDELKARLLKYGPLAVGIVQTPAFKKYRSGVFSGDPKPGSKEFLQVSERSAVDHGVVIVGWDEELDAWEIKNSYGTTWGDDGFGWVKYGTNKIGYGAAWLVVDR